ncbi:hypothetical protein K4A83_03335 [Spirulina subsalsa FACHB-351]|uniref:HEAT repeat domain-containing protein n=1 Tax=Spirulina subsalsa FACHB-351 TaxID=234711 RepID=A0ABT3L1D0_9CYAN|nr:hypothetical protein [Spirulina subsalsa]MCW6035308.1 hypothetical protein [Spirulina subsalsa FACHB-351]
MKTPPRQPLETLTELLQLAVRLPGNWLKPILLISFISLFQVHWTQNEGWDLTFGVNNTTVLILLVAWLPAVLQLFALVGGMIKTPAAELSSGGIDPLLQFITRETKDEMVGAVHTVLEDAQKTALGAQRVHLQEMEEQLAQEYGGMLTHQQARQEMKQLAQRYQALQSAPTGTRRNFLFEAIAGAMRSLVFQAGWTDTEISSHLNSEHDGRRLVGLSCLGKMEEAAAYFPDILRIIGDSRSAFEQRNALEVMEKMLPRLDAAQKAELQEVLLQQGDYDVSKHQWIRPGSERRVLSDRLLSLISDPS